MTEGTLQVPILHGLVMRFREAGLKLSVRDYLDGLQALQRFPEPFSALQGVIAGRDRGDDGSVRFEAGIVRIRQREEIVWFCQTMWARSDEERRIVRDIVTREIGLAHPGIMLEALTRLQGTDTLSWWPHQDRPPTTPDPPPAPKSRDETVAEERPARAPTEAYVSAEPPVDGGLSLAIEEAAGLPVPSPPAPPEDTAQRYVFDPEPLISSLWLTALWRRLFRPVRRIDHREIDAEETVRRAIRNAGLLEPAFKLRRVNAARLLVLVDVSVAMAPWIPFEETLSQTLMGSGSRLAEVGLAYFSGMPRETVYQTPTLQRPVPMERLFTAFRGAPVLVFGEAGAAVAPRRDFAERLDHFLGQATALDVKPLVWINPMPAQRWQPLMKDRLATYPHAHLLPLDGESLLRAVDILRGNRQ